MRTIALEEHFAIPAFLSGPGRAMAEQARGAGGGRILDLLADVGDERIATMDRAGIDVQVLSLTAPGVEQSEAGEAVPLARETNDHAAEVVRRHPDRFAAFAALPTAAPERAADELERVVREHGFVGALINGHTRGRYLDDEFFWPILERAEALRVPIYLHPTPPPRPVIEAYYLGNYAPEVAEVFATSGWGVAHRDRHSCPAYRAQWRFRPLPRTPGGDRSHGRRSVIHDAAIRTRHVPRREAAAPGR